MASMTNVLFLCTGNSARSLIAEGILRHHGGSRYRAFSAGSTPTGKPNPFALAVLQRHGIDTEFARSKSWDEFATADAEQMNIIITVCDNAAGEVCPIWPGQPITAHWGWLIRQASPERMRQLPPRSRLPMIRCLVALRSF